ncbi:hypothetical protein [Legionella maceachernii]|nr:hypothetical protein [Legionella maceachernii]
MPHQVNIAKNLSKYLSFCYAEHFTKQGQPVPYELQTIVADLENKGQCFGFTLIHAAMDTTNQLYWWEYVLELLETWDGTPDALQQKISARADFYRINLTDLPKKNKDELQKLTLGDLFERAVNYLVYHQIGLATPFFTQDSDQLTILNPVATGKNLFEILDPNGNLLTIKSRQIAAVGSLRSDEVEAVLDNDPQVIHLVHSSNHTIRVGAHGDRWFVYEPNYKRDDSQPIFKYLRYFSNKTEATQELFRILGPEIAIEKISIYQQISSLPMPPLSKEMGSRYMNHFSPQTFKVLAKYSPHALAELVTYLDEKHAPENKQLKASFAKALQQKCTGGWTGLHLMARYAPDALTRLMAQLPHDESAEDLELKKNLTSALCEKTPKQTMGFYMAFLYAPDAFTHLLTNKNILFPMSDIYGRSVYLTTIEQAIAVAYANNNSAMFQNIFSQLKKENNPLTAQTIQKIADTFAYPHHSQASQWITQQLLKLDPQQALVNELQQSYCANPNILLESFLQLGFNLQTPYPSSSLTLGEHLAAYTFSKRAWIPSQQIQALFSKLRSVLDEKAIQRIADTFPDSAAGRELKVWIYQELIKKELAQPDPNKSIILNALAQGKHVWGQVFNTLPYTAPFSGQPIYLTVAEQAIACAYKINDAALLEKVLSEFKKEFITFNGQLIQKIAATFPYPADQSASVWISQQFINLEPQQALNNELQRGTCANPGIVLGALLHPANDEILKKVTTIYPSINQQIDTSLIKENTTPKLEDNRYRFLSADITNQRIDSAEKKIHELTPNTTRLS